MRKIYLLAFAGCCLFSNAFSQAPASWTSADMYLAIRKLNVLGAVLYIAAHPDDENTRLITYLSKDRLYRTGYLSMTRGDGGQNLIGDEQGIELGLIRTQELLAARRVDGGEQFFTRAYDFGYSKTPEETFTKWDKEKILSDVVWVIRKFQPDVIVTRFASGPQPGNHGHHVASSILANEAFIAAADPNRFSEQLKYVQPWKAQRILLNTANFGGNNQTSNDQFKFDVGGYNPLLGKSYGEIAAASRSNHKSQGFGSAATRGEALEYFKTTGGTAPVNDIMDGVEPNWKRVAGGELISRIIDSLSSTFDLLRPERSVEQLVRLYRAMKALPDGYWKTQKLAEVYQLIAQCSGLFLDATTQEQFAIQTDSLRINFSFNNRLGTDAILQKVQVDGFDSSFSRTLEKNKNVNFSKTIFVPPTHQVTQPYWLVNKMEEGYFNVADQLAIGKPDVDPSYHALIQLKIFGELFNFAQPVRYKFTDPVRGELYEPLVILPPVIVSADRNVVITKDNNEFAGILKITAKKRNAYAGFSSVGRKMPDNFKYKFAPDTLIIQDKNQTKEVTYEIKGNVDNEYTLFSTSNGKVAQVNYDMHEIKYDHVPYINYFKPVTVINKKLDLKIYNKKIAYIVGAGDKVPEALEQMGYEINVLTQKEISKNSLDKFDAIIVGVRAYNTNEWMSMYYDKLMKYVNDGGNLIVQYNTSNQIGPVRAKIGPYNFNITRTRVTDENAKVTMLKPEHPVFNYPNKITDEDFKGWIQERSIYHGSDTTGKFEKLIGMSDPGEKSDDGSLLIARYGKGWFTYTGLVFFRELPAGVPGAYRLLANIIALNKKKGF